MSPEAEQQEGNSFRGWSNADDTRSRLGTYNVAQTHQAYRKLVRAEAVFSEDNTWYWTPSQYRTITDELPDDPIPFSATPWDIGMIVTHNSRMGDVVGWMGWAWWSSDATFANRTHYNRGYPGCNNMWSNRPAGCANFPSALWGDTEACDPQASTGSEQSIDSNGINRRFRMHCDSSPNQSGASTYTYLDGTTLAVTGVHNWEHCATCSAGNDRPNTSVRITKIYSDSISTLRSTFP